MTCVNDIAEKVRTKNAGPFWLTVDIFCGSAEAFDIISGRLATVSVARSFGLPLDQVKRFDIRELRVVKFSVPRPSVQGTVADRDMHGASYAFIVGCLEV